jgi:ABC transporter, ATP-binding protein
VSVQFGEKPLFENVSVKFGDGNRYGLIGANGAGKSTFMKVIGGELEPTSGEVILQKDLRLGKLRQDQFAYEQEKVMDVVLQGHQEMWQVMNERDAIYMDPQASEEDYMRAADLEVQFAEYGGYTAQARAAELLTGAGVPETLHLSLMQEIPSDLKIRVLLAQALFANPDVLLLDEPTNHLDINTIRWLENVLNNSQSTMVIISHDRHFLNQVCTHIADVDYGNISIYTGNYDDYMLASTRAREQLLRDNAKAKEKLKELQEFVARFSANKSKARQATSRLKQADKIKEQMIEVKPSSRQSPYMRFIYDDKLKIHRFVVEVKNISKTYAHPLFKHLSFTLEAGERLAIIGPNGAGKSSLLKALVHHYDEKLADIQLDEGEIKWAEKVKLGYYPQDHEAYFDLNLSMADWLAQWQQPGDDEQMVRSILGRLLFSGNEVQKPVNVLSGGEKGRLIFGKLLLLQANVLVMDEPTNHMDMETIESLNLALEKYTGTLIFVSHDRQLVSSLATQIIELDGQGGAEFYPGDYESYLLKKQSVL